MYYSRNPIGRRSRFGSRFNRSRRSRSAYGRGLGGRKRPWRRNSAPVWGGPLYRRNSISLARRQELQTKSPGNMRRPTLAATKDFLDDWRTAGVSNMDEMVAGGDDIHSVAGTFEDRASDWGSTSAIEHAKAINRYDEAMSYYAPYKAEQDLYDTDPETYYKPKFTQPKGGWEAAVAEESAKEEEAAVTPGVGAEETLIPAKVESSIEEGETVPAVTETDSTVEQTNPEEETDKATSFMEWLKAKQQ